MLKIGDFARIGQVSVRMLRHYDALGLLVPAHVDAWTGYRSYSAEQLARLNRLVALKELGFTLEQVHSLLEGDRTGDELLAMLRMRQEQLTAEADQARRRLADVERRLRLIEREGSMSDYEFVTKALPALRLAELTADVDAQPEIGEAIGPLYQRLAPAILATGAPLGPSIGWYEMDAEGGGRIHAAWEYAGAPAPGFEIAELPTEASAVCTTYVGPVTHINEPWQAVARHIEASGLQVGGPCREIYLEQPADLDPEGQWVVEIQMPVQPACD